MNKENHTDQAANQTGSQGTSSNSLEDLEARFNRFEKHVKSALSSIQVELREINSVTCYDPDRWDP